MDVEGKTAASVQDASFLKKESVVVDEKSNNAVVVDKSVALASPAASAIELKKTEADCSSTMIEEKDDLLDQIDEVCHDKVESTEDISKASENEFLKKIEEMESNDVKSPVKEKPHNVSEELKAKHIIECEASAVEDVVVGDKVLDVNNEMEAGNNKSLASSSVDVKNIASPIKTLEGCSENTTANEVSPNKDALVTSSTTPKVGHDNPAGGDAPKVNTTDSKVESTESVASMEIAVESNDIEKMETVELDGMEIDDNAAPNVDVMEVEDAKETVSVDENVEMLSEDNSVENEAKPKIELEINDVDMKDTLAAKTKERQQPSETKPCVGNNSDPAEATNSCNEPEKTNNEQVKEEAKKSESNVSNHKEDKEVVEIIDSSDTDDSSIIATPLTAAKVGPEVKSAENKILLDLKSKQKDNIVSSSLTNTPVSSSNVFNSTPIQKQFEISSENVSKISDVAELSHTDKEEEATSTKPLSKSFEDSTTESGTCATSESEQPSSDGATKKYIDAIKKYNGMPDTTTDEEETSTPNKNQKSNEKFEIKLSDLSSSDLKKDSTYEVNVCWETNDVRYLSIERVDLSSIKNKSETDKQTESSVQSSSNGSVTSLPAYSLPQQAGNTPTTSASTSSSINCHSLLASQNKHTILGIEELCNFMINQFVKIKNAVNPESAKQPAAGGIIEQSTPTTQTKKNKKNSPSTETPSTSSSKSKRARKRSLHEDDTESTPKAKQPKRDTVKETPKAGDDAADSDVTKAGPCVLAKWVDRKFYAGKITGEKPGNKFVVLFEDGASKTLPKESIVFGEDDTLPLQDQQIYALVDEDYENGVVMSIEKSSNKVYYNVKTETTTVKVTASDIYLEVDQAKEIQKMQNVNKVSEGVEEEETFGTGTRPSRNKRPPASPSTPEAGYSGAVGKRGGKRQKRYS